MVKVDWKGGRVFEATPPYGAKFRMDADPAEDGSAQGPTPLEALLSSAAACSAVDVIIVMEKKRQKVTEYWVEIEGERAGPEGQYPRPYTKITMRHILRGENLDPEAVKRAVQLSDEKYCTVVATLRAAPEVISEYEIHPE